jgi:hypothetical protein
LRGSRALLTRRRALGDRTLLARRHTLGRRALWGRGGCGGSSGRRILCSARDGAHDGGTVHGPHTLRGLQPRADLRRNTRRAAGRLTRSSRRYRLLWPTRLRLLLRRLLRLTSAALVEHPKHHIPDDGEATRHECDCLGLSICDSFVDVDFVLAEVWLNV